MAFDQAQLSPADIPVAEVHDCFTIAEILAIEDLGFVEKGSGGPATLDGQTGYESDNPQVLINPSGGLKASGHPVGATGVKQIAHLDHLLASGQYDHGLAHNVGGSGGTAVVHILESGAS
jgi:acetyl-CoA C-acetyltransferase